MFFELNLAKLPRDVILVIFSFLSNDVRIISYLRYGKVILSIFIASGLGMNYDYV